MKTQLVVEDDETMRVRRFNYITNHIRRGNWLRTQTLIDAFGVSKAQAKEDIELWRARNPGRLQWSAGRKAWMPVPVKGGQR